MQWLKRLFAPKKPVTTLKLVLPNSESMRDAMSGLDAALQGSIRAHGRIVTLVALTDLCAQCLIALGYSSDEAALLMQEVVQNRYNSELN